MRYLLLFWGGGIAFAPSRAWADTVEVGAYDDLVEAINNAPTNGDERIIVLAGDVGLTHQIKISGNYTISF